MANFKFLQVGTRTFEALYGPYESRAPLPLVRRRGDAIMRRHAGCPFVRETASALRKWSYQLCVER